MSEVTKERVRNPRGAGARLRSEILDGAGRILDETGRDDAVTLRAIARRIGVTPPSIYSHFPDREAILTALVTDGFAELSGCVRAAHESSGDDPARRLRAGCQAYLDFARRQPERYQLMFGTRHHVPQDEPYASTSGAASFATLTDTIAACVAAGRSASTDAGFDATAVLIALHGYAVLRPSRPAFPWPDEQALLDHVVTSLARLTGPPSDAGRPAQPGVQPTAKPAAQPAVTADVQTAERS